MTIPLVGGSDAHFPFEVGRLSTRIDAERLTPEAVVAAVRDGRVEPVFRDGPLFKVLGSLYTRIHGAKGHTPGDGEAGRDSGF